MHVQWALTTVPSSLTMHHSRYVFESCWLASTDADSALACLERHHTFHFPTQERIVSVAQFVVLELFLWVEANTLHWIHENIRCCYRRKVSRAWWKSKLHDIVIQRVRQLLALEGQLVLVAMLCTRFQALKIFTCHGCEAVLRCKRQRALRRKHPRWGARCLLVRESLLETGASQAEVARQEASRDHH